MSSEIHSDSSMLIPQVGNLQASGMQGHYLMPKVIINRIIETILVLTCVVNSTLDNNQPNLDL